MPGHILINPSVFDDKRDAMAVALNEALRLFMEDTRFTPKFEPTPEQRKFFSGTAYAGDEDALRKTIVARVATFDTSVRPTGDQVSETRRLLSLVMEALGSKHPDYGLVQKIDELLAPKVDTKSPVTRPSAQTEGTAQDDMLGGDVLKTGHALDKIPARIGTPNSLIRIDGSAKGEGFFGRVPYRSEDPRDYMTEQSIGDGNTLKPLLVPTLTPDEIVAIATPGARVPESAFDKAEKHAAERTARGEPVFALPGERKELHPGLINMMKARSRGTPQDAANGGNVSEPPKIPWGKAAMEYLMKTEEFRSVAYPDPGDQTGKWSVGYGNQFHPGQERRVRKGDRVDRAKAAEYMADAVAYNSGKLREAVGPEVWNRMTGGEKLALTSWAYNVGERHVKGSTLAKRLRAGEAVSGVIEQELPKWRNRGMLSNRRAEEVKLSKSTLYE